MSLFFYCLRDHLFHNIKVFQEKCKRNVFENSSLMLFNIFAKKKVYIKEREVFKKRPDVERKEG